MCVTTNMSTDGDRSVPQHLKQGDQIVFNNHRVLYSTANTCFFTRRSSYLEYLCLK